jgi:broad specificity phosphatase PhoE
MTIFLLIRHGENDFVGKSLAGRLPGVHLNQAGIRQAEELRLALGQIPIHAIYSSPLERAIETAQPLATGLNLPIQLEAGLSEMDFGDWQGRSLKQVRRLKLWKDIHESTDQSRFPAGESYVEAQDRLVRTILQISSRHKPKEVVACFSHSDSIRLIIAHLLAMPLNSFHRLAIDTASVTVFSLANAQPHLLHTNLVLPFTLILDQSLTRSSKNKKR